MAYSLENTADLTNLADAVRAKTGNTGVLTVEEMGTAIRNLPENTPPATQLKRLYWSRTQSVTLGRNSSKSFTISAMNKNKKYPFVFFTKIAYGTGYPRYSVLVVYDGTQNIYTYTYTAVDVKGSLVFNNDNAVLTLKNNTRTSYDMRFTDNVNPPAGGEEFAELFYFPPVE